MNPPDEGGQLPGPRQSARRVDLVRVHYPDRRQHSLHVARRIRPDESRAWSLCPRPSTLGRGADVTIGIVHRRPAGRRPSPSQASRRWPSSLHSEHGAAPAAGRSARSSLRCAACAAGCPRDPLVGPAPVARPPKARGEEIRQQMDEGMTKDQIILAYQAKWGSDAASRCPPDSRRIPRDLRCSRLGAHPGRRRGARCPRDAPARARTTTGAGRGEQGERGAIPAQQPTRGVRRVRCAPRRRAEGPR